MEHKFSEAVLICAIIQEPAMMAPGQEAVQVNIITYIYKKHLGCRDDSEKPHITGNAIHLHGSASVP